MSIAGEITGVFFSFVIVIVRLRRRTCLLHKSLRSLLSGILRNRIVITRRLSHAKLMLAPTGFWDFNIFVCVDFAITISLLNLGKITK